jgi:hypothetical protein
MERQRRGRIVRAYLRSYAITMAAPFSRTDSTVIVRPSDDRERVSTRTLLVPLTHVSAGFAGYRPASKRLIPRPGSFVEFRRVSPPQGNFRGNFSLHKVRC